MSVNIKYKYALDSNYCRAYFLTNLRVFFFKPDYSKCDLCCAVELTNRIIHPTCSQRLSVGMYYIQDHAAGFEQRTPFSDTYTMKGRVERPPGCDRK